MTYPGQVRIYEVGPRDGLQNESTTVALDSKLEYIRLLRDAGLSEIEATSFVSPRAIPQLTDADELMARSAAAPNVPGRATRFSSRTCAAWPARRPPAPKRWPSSPPQATRSRSATSG